MQAAVSGDVVVVAGSKSTIAVAGADKTATLSVFLFSLCFSLSHSLVAFAAPFSAFVNLTQRPLIPEPGMHMLHNICNRILEIYSMFCVLF